jgi:hypothetical protein
MSYNQYSDYKQYLKNKDSIYYYNYAKKLQTDGSTDYTLISVSFYKAIVLNKNNIDAVMSIQKMITDGEITSEECIAIKITARAELLTCYSVTDLK